MPCDTKRSHTFFAPFRRGFSSIGHCSDNRPGRALHRILRRIAPVLFTALAAVAACDDRTAAAPEATPAARHDSGCGETGTLSARLIGNIETLIDWTPPGLACDSMPRPAGEGLRLRFTGQVDGQPLAFIVAIPALEPGTTAEGLVANVTLAIEGTGRFFSTADLESCWADIPATAPLDGDRYAIEGLVYCLSPLGEVNGDAAVTLDELRFNTLADWSSR